MIVDLWPCIYYPVWNWHWPASLPLRSSRPFSFVVILSFKHATGITRAQGSVEISISDWDSGLCSGSEAHHKLMKIGWGCCCERVQTDSFLLTWIREDKTSVTFKKLSGFLTNHVPVLKDSHFYLDFCLKRSLDLCPYLLTTVQIREVNCL